MPILTDEDKSIFNKLKENFIAYGKKPSRHFLWVYFGKTNNERTQNNQIDGVSLSAIQQKIINYRNMAWPKRWFHRLFTNIKKLEALYAYVQIRQHFLLSLEDKGSISHGGKFFNRALRNLWQEYYHYMPSLSFFSRLYASWRTFMINIEILAIPEYEKRASVVIYNNVNERTPLLSAPGLSSSEAQQVVLSSSPDAFEKIIEYWIEAEVDYYLEDKRADFVPGRVVEFLQEHGVTPEEEKVEVFKKEQEETKREVLPSESLAAWEVAYKALQTQIKTELVNLEYTMRQFPPGTRKNQLAIWKAVQNFKISIKKQFSHYLEIYNPEKYAEYHRVLIDFFKKTNDRCSQLLKPYYDDRRTVSLKWKKDFEKFRGNFKKKTKLMTVPESKEDEDNNSFDLDEEDLSLLDLLDSEDEEDINEEGFLLSEGLEAVLYRKKNGRSLFSNESYGITLFQPQEIKPGELNLTNAHRTLPAKNNLEP